MSTAVWQTPTYTINAELYFDPQTKKPDLWVQFAPADSKERFVATSLPDRVKAADYRLKASPMIKMGESRSFVFDAYDTAKNQWDGDHGFALIFNYRTATTDLGETFIKDLDKQFPGAVVRDAASGEPKRIKALMTRITWKQVYPVAAFNAEPKF